MLLCSSANYLNTGDADSNAGNRLVPFQVQVSDLLPAARVRVDDGARAGHLRSKRVGVAAALVQGQVVVVTSAVVTAALQLETHAISTLYTIWYGLERYPGQNNRIAHFFRPI
jgi:hypothetical protein